MVVFSSGKTPISVETPCSSYKKNALSLELLINAYDREIRIQAERSSLPLVS